MSNRLCIPAAIYLAFFASSPSEGMSLISRANCFNNESITWDISQMSYPAISVISAHKWVDKHLPDFHAISDSRSNDNAAKAIHWGEGVGMPGGSYWEVNGQHSWVDIFGDSYSGYSSATFCMPGGGGGE